MGWLKCVLCMEEGGGRCKCALQLLVLECLEDRNERRRMLQKQSFEWRMLEVLKS